MNLDREFIKWFYEEQYPEMGSNRRQCYGMTAGTTNINIIDYWMREAFKAGAESVLATPKYLADEGSLTAEQLAAIKTTAEFELGSLTEQQAFDKQRNYPL